MFGRRQLLAGMGAGMIGGLPPRRPDQMYRPPGPPGPVGGSAGIQRARTLIVGSAGQIMIATTVNFTVGVTGTVSNLSGFSNLTGVIAFVPSATTPPTPASPMQGPVVITYSDASQAEAYLVLSGITGSGNGFFELYAGVNNITGKPGGIITGAYNNLNPGVAAITLLMPNVQEMWIGGPGGLTEGRFRAPAPGDTSLFPAAEFWHPMTLTAPWVNRGAGFPVASYQLDGFGNLQLAGSISSGVTNVANGAQIGSVSAGYFSAVNQYDTCVDVWQGAAAPSAGQTFRVNLDTAGNLFFFGVATAGVYKLSLNGITLPISRG